MNLHIIHHFDPEHLGLLRGLNRKLNHITERLEHMATDEQIATIKTDTEALLKAVADHAAKPPAPPPTPVADPALDDLDARVKAATASLTPAPAAPAADPAPEQPAT